MKKIYLFLFAFVCPLLAISQTFQKKTSWRDNSFIEADVQWVDINNDSLLDVMVSGKNKSQAWQMKPFRNVINQAQGFTPAPVTTYAITSTDYAFSDFDRDNRTDLIVTGKKANGTSVLASFINKGNFSFTVSEQNSPASAVSDIQFADLDNDGRADIIISDNQSLKILKATTSGYTPKFDSLGLIISGIAIRDFNADGQQDIVVSGKNTNNVPFLFFMNNQGRFKFKKTAISNPQAGVIETGDANHDGQFDFIISGSNKRNNQQINFYTNSDGKFQATDSIMGYPATQLFCADFNSDGLTDLYFSGKQANGNRFNRIQQSNKTIVSLDTTGVRSQSFGDYDRDGDLDILRVVDSASYFVFQVLENTTLPLNASPSVPAQGFAISTPDRTFIYWQASTDDHTPQKALTYDLILRNESGNEVVAPAFDLSSKTRKQPTHGNQTTNNFAMIKELTDQRYFYLVQSVDNAFNGNRINRSSGGSGGSGESLGISVVSCFDLKHEYVQTCKNTVVTLTSELPAFWFSVKDGLLEQSTKHEFVASVTDTLYSFVPQGTDCSKNIIWIIKVNDKSLSEKATVYTCENVDFKLGITPGWKDPLWKIGSQTLAGDTIMIKTDQPEVVTVAAGSGTGCTYQKEFQIKISKPVFSLNGDAFTITKGQSVTLQASGAKDYLWQPPQGLSNTNVATTEASPRATIEYTVIASDSVGCKASGKIIVYVEEIAFIPNLFTPNGDGKNDELKIYGITDASHFKFSIFNRDGSVVYETQDINQATNSGWNGTHKGTPQSSGLYYWKVEGSFNNGQAVTLNGKSNGSILLVK